MSAVKHANTKRALALLAVLLFAAPIAATARESLAWASGIGVQHGDPIDLVDDLMRGIGLNGQWEWEPGLRKEIVRHLDKLTGRQWSMQLDGVSTLFFADPVANPRPGALKHDLTLKFTDHGDHLTVKQWLNNRGRTVFTVNHYAGRRGSLLHRIRIERPRWRAEGRVVVHNERRHTSNPGWRPWKGKTRRVIEPPRPSW